MYKMMCRRIAQRGIEAKKAVHRVRYQELQTQYNEAVENWRSNYNYGDYNNAEAWRQSSESYQSQMNKIQAELNANDEAWYRTLLDEDRRFNVLPMYQNTAAEG